MPQITGSVLAGHPDRGTIATICFVTLHLCKIPNGVFACPHIPHFLTFSEEPDIIVLFQELTGTADYAVNVQEVLLADNFLVRVGEAIERLEVVPHYGGRSLMALGLFQILKLCANAPRFYGPIRTIPVMRRFVRPFSGCPLAVKAARWRALEDLVTPENRDVFKQLLDEAAAELTFGEVLREHQALIMRIFAKLSISSQTVARGLIERKFPDLLRNVFLTWPSSSIAHACVGQCLLMIIESEFLRPHAVGLVRWLAQADVCGPHAVHRIARVSALAILQNLRERTVNSKSWNAFVQKCVPPGSESWRFVDEQIARAAVLKPH